MSRRRERSTGFAAVLAVALLTGCASTNPQPVVDRVDADVARRTGRRIFWNQDGDADEAVRRAVKEMLADGVTEDEAVQIALINNRSLQATYEELGVAQAEVVQAGLLKNPVFRGSYRIGDADSPLPDWTFGVEQDFLSIFMLPARKRIANAQREVAEARVTSAVLRTTRDVRAAYLTVAAAEQTLATQRAIGEAAEVTAELAKRQVAAGTASELDAANEVVQYEQLRLDLGRSEVVLAAKREEVTRLLGLWGADIAWRGPVRLPEIPASDPPLEHLEMLAVDHRADMAAARAEAEVARRVLGTARTFRFFGGASVGLTVDRHRSGATGPKEWSLEPGASLEVPLFDQRQAVIARLEAEARQAEHRLSATAVDARSDVRVARARLLAERATVNHYRTVLVPMRERLVALAQQQYDSMLIGIYQLLQAKTNELAAYRGYVESVRDYWIARADLELAIGGRLPREKSPMKGTP